MSQTQENKHSFFPIYVMIAFSLLLIGALFYRVYLADKDLGELKIEKIQARLAAESGINYAIARINDSINFSQQSFGGEILSSTDLSNILEKQDWLPLSSKANASFRIVSVRKVDTDDDKATPLIDEGLRYRILSEGKCRNHRYTTNAIIQLYDLSKTFGVFQSLDEFYYGTPIRPWIEVCGSLEKFINANRNLFIENKLNRFGLCLDADLLLKIFTPDLPSPFKQAEGEKIISGNFGKYYRKIAISPSFGPLYSSYPIIIDSHTFNDALQSALYIYKRPQNQAKINFENRLTAVNSSLRVQKAADRIESKNSNNFIVDYDSEGYKSFIPNWRPNIEYLRELSKSRFGIYIDETGKGHQNGKPMSVDYHPGSGDFFSDSYMGPNSPKVEHDKLIANKYIVLASDGKYDDYNNLSIANLNGARILFSERSIFIRGEIESDLVIVTPGHIFITGPTNIDSNLNLMLIGEQGTAISATDLQEVIATKKPSKDFIDAAREWIIKAIIYKPGAGVYASTLPGNSEGEINFRGLFDGKSLKLKIKGSCIGGNLQRWIDNTELDSLRIEHLQNSAERLCLRPLSANILKIRTEPENID